MVEEKSEEEKRIEKLGGRNGDEDGPSMEKNKEIKVMLDNVDRWHYRGLAIRFTVRQSRSP